MLDKNKLQINITKNEFENFKTYSLGKNKTHLRTAIISLVLCLIFIICYNIFRYSFMERFIGSDSYLWLASWTRCSLVSGFLLRFFFVYFDLVVTILLTALCGSSVGAVFVWIVFNVATFASQDGFAYAFIVMLSATLITNLPSRRGWFKSFPKALLATLVMTFIIGLALHIVENVISAGEYGGVLLCDRIVARAFPVAFISSMLLYLYHRFMPQKIKNLFPESDFSSPQIRNFQKNIIKNRKYHIGGKILSIIVSGFVLMMMVSVAVSGSLIEDFNNPPNDVEKSIFMTKLVQLILIEMIPWIFLAIDFIRLWVSSPLLLMALAVRDSSEQQKDPNHEIVADINKLDIKNQDEIGVLYNSLKRADGHLQAYLKSVQEKIELEKNLVAAEAASEAKSTFLSSMSHEIRSPINAVLGLDEMIIRESHESEIKSYATDIQSSGKMLLSVVNDILDFSKIEAGKMEIIPVDYDMSMVISDLVNMIESRAAKKGLEFIVNVDEKMPHLLHGDDTRLKQCILNILTNAVKYTQKGSFTLTMNARKIDETHVAIFVSVKDTGIGIKQEDIKKLFSPFERIEEGRNRAIEGTGLGMSIVKSLLASMGTGLDVQSVYGEGSDFSFSVVQEVRDWEPIGNYAETKKRLQEAAAVYTESFQAPEAKILVVDDTPINLTVMKGLLKETRVQIDTAESGAVALEKAKSQKYDVIFIDHLMPKMDGLQLLAELRKSTINELSVVSETDGSEASTVADGQTNDSSENTNLNLKTPCIALTANAMDDIKAFYKNAGFEDYLSKPIEPKLLEEMLQNYLPREKVLHKGDNGFVEKAKSEPPLDSDIRQNDSESANPHAESTNCHAELVSASKNSEPDETQWQAVSASAISDTFFKNRFGIDISLALKNCGGEDVFIEAAENFYDSIDEKSALIEEYAKSGDWKNYTILVHALKSSARLIGANELSELAKKLEAAGDEAQKVENGKLKTENVAQNASTTITQKTTELIAYYRDYKAKLASLLGKSVVSMNSTTSPASENTTKPEISQSQLADAISALREVISVFDFDSADSIIKELDGYAIPADFSEKFSAIKKAVRDVDQAKIMELLK